MTEFPKAIKFKYPWRTYQQKVLDDLNRHLNDQHLHVIAPPGSGKTVLGLEVAIRINKPTLILAPTLAIRNQWIQRFCELFLQIDSVPDWISRDIKNPKFLTVVTYQGLHAACNDLKDEDSIFEDQDEDENLKSNQKSNGANLNKIIVLLKKQQIGTVVVDEAHHLNNQWWRTLTNVKTALNPTIVGLTATPPYDVSAQEWQRYIDLNGAVDTEISVPELMMEGDLCPHQDYIHFTFPTQAESDSILRFRENIEKLFFEIRNDKTLISAIENHPIWLKPTEHLEWIYSNLSYYSACLIFMHSNGKLISEEHLEVIGDKTIEIPPFDYEWIEILMEFYLYKDNQYFLEYEEHQKSLENKLRKYGALEKKTIKFFHNKRVSSFLTSSISKLNGIQKIVDFEYQICQNQLRMVILPDFIRKEYLVTTSENTLDLNKIGVISIFEKLRRANDDKKKIAVLTGSIIIVPVSAYQNFLDIALIAGITEISSSKLTYDDSYLEIHQTALLKNDIIRMVTQLFEAGKIEILIGTKALLGEGWDAPAINSLILASFVGSFVMSNQMRGRAIRVQNGNLSKTSNIWHLVTVDSTSFNGGDDFDLMQRRFRGFVGVSFREEASIENGIGRLNLPKNIFEKEQLEKKNSEMFEAAASRDTLQERWAEAIKSGVMLIEEIKIPFSENENYQKEKKIHLDKTIRNFILTLGSAILTFSLEGLQFIIRAVRNIKTLKELYFYLSLVGIAGMILFGRKTVKAFKLYTKYRDIAKDIENIGNALLVTLIKFKIIKTPISELKVSANVDTSGSVYCHLEGGSTFEKSTFIIALQEITGKVDNPRYIIVRRNKFMLLLNQKDYHSVPEIIGRNKTMAEFYGNQWAGKVGKCDLIYTRTIEGRKMLLRSRLKSLSSQLENKIEHINKWR